MMMFICLLSLVSLATSTSPPANPSPPPPPVPTPAAEGPQADHTDEHEAPLQQAGKTKTVTIEAGHYKVDLEENVLDKITELFNKMDSNEDDTLDSGEFTAEWENLDTDGDGMLSRSEVSGKLTWFQLYATDVDGDGIATNREFERAPKSLDLDGNGKVELSEFLVMVGMIRNDNQDSHNTYQR